jgi:hypothetical protein
MIKYIPLILLLLLSACSPAQAGKSKPTAAQAQAQGVMLALPTQAPATDTPAPTVDTSELIRRVSEAEQLAQEAISKKNEAVADKNASDATANAANVRALEMTSTLGAQGIERANIFGTQQVIAATSNAAQIAQNSAFATQTKQAPADAATAEALMIASKNADTAAKIEPLRSGVLAVSPIILILVIGFLVYLAISREQIAPEELVQVDENEAELPEPAPKPDEPPGDVEKFRALIEYAKSPGNLLGQIGVVRDKIYPGYYEYAPVLDWLERRGWVTKSETGGKVFSPSGKALCEAWELRHSPSAG